MTQWTSGSLKTSFLKFLRTQNSDVSISLLKWLLFTLHGLAFKSGQFLVSLELLITTFHRTRSKHQKRSYSCYIKPLKTVLLFYDIPFFTRGHSKTPKALRRKQLHFESDIFEGNFTFDGFVTIENYRNRKIWSKKLKIGEGF